MNPVYFLSLLAIVYGELTIDIDTNDKPPVQPFIDVRGFVPEKLISDVERATFGIEDAALKKAVATYTKDSVEPNFVYIKKVGDKDFSQFPEWLEVKTIVKPIYIDLKPKPTCKDVANTTKTILTVKTEWKINGNLSVADKIKHIVYYGNQNFKTHTKNWGESFNQTATMELAPGDTLQECTLKVSIDYEVTLSGDVAVDYTKPRTLHHYYAYDLIKIQDKAGLKKSVVNTETITVTYYKYAH